VARPASIPSPTCESSYAGAPATALTRWRRYGWTSSGTCTGCKTYAGTSPQPSRGAYRSWSGFYRVCVIDAILEHSPADYVRRPTVPTESPTLGLGHLQFEALITTARLSTNPNDFALVALLGLLGLRIFEACGSNIADLGEEHGHRVLRVRGKGGKVVLVPLPPAVARAIDRAVDDRTSGPILRNTLGARMDRHAATRRLKHLAHAAGIRMPRMHPTCCATHS
jgi:integrase